LGRPFVAKPARPKSGRAPRRLGVERRRLGRVRPPRPNSGQSAAAETSERRVGGFQTLGVDLLIVKRRQGDDARAKRLIDG